jgi:uncharacterized membrane protein YphA (DoxX/SURF4 family)
MTTAASSNVREVSGTSADDGAMNAVRPNQRRDKPTASVWGGRVMSGLVIAFLLIASVFPKLFLPALAEESMRQLGFQPKHLLVVAIIELTGTLLYAFARTAPLGAVLLTGLFGGAIATHLRMEHPLWGHTLFPLWVGLLMWGGLWLRRADLRAFVRQSLLGHSHER